MGFKVAESDGGYFLWARLSGQGKKWADAFEFALSLYQAAQIAVVPGENFSRTKTDYIRINIGTGLPVIEGAAVGLKKFFLSAFQERKESNIITFDSFC